MNITNLIYRMYYALPPRTRTKLKTLVGAAGHRRSVLDELRARQHATTKKRLDTIAQGLERLVAKTLGSLVDRQCLEFGAGYLPTESLFYYLCGAKTIISVDYNRIAHLKFFLTAIDDADMELTRRVAVSLGTPSELFDLRLAQFRETLAQRDLSRVEALIGYRAPLDMRHHCFERQIDFAHSVSVLEHIHPADIPAILRNLNSSLKSGGVMVHEIDLRDHLDLSNNPLAFTSCASDYDATSDYDTRGNGLRLSEWLGFFGELKDTVTTYFEQRRLPNSAIPSDISPRYVRYAKEELLVGEVALVTRRL